MRAPGHTRTTGSGGRGAAPPAALAALAALVAAGVLGLGLFTLAPRVTRHRLDALRPVASHAAPALDGAHVLRVYDEIDRGARKLPRDERALVARTILEEAARAELAPELVLAVIHVESRFRHRAASPRGALGMMQLRPSTLNAELARARIRSADPLDPVANVRAGVRYLGRLVRAFGDTELALVAYNAGPARLRRHLASGQVPERLLRYAELVRREVDARMGEPRGAAAAFRRPADAGVSGLRGAPTALRRHADAGVSGPHGAPAAARRFALAAAHAAGAPLALRASTGRSQPVVARAARASSWASAPFAPFRSKRTLAQQLRALLLAEGYRRARACPNPLRPMRARRAQGIR